MSDYDYSGNASEHMAAVTKEESLQKLLGAAHFLQDEPKDIMRSLTGLKLPQTLRSAGQGYIAGEVEKSLQVISQNLDQLRMYVESAVRNLQK